MGRISWERVAENIMTCFCWGVARNISCRTIVSHKPHFGHQVETHTDLIQHLITLIEDEDLDASQTQMLIPNERIKTPRGCDDDVRVLILVLEDLDILLHRRTSIEDRSPHVRHVLTEPRVLVLDLVCQLSCVAHDQDGRLPGDRIDLLKRCKNEDGSFTKTRLGLAEDIGSKDRLRNAHLLD